MATKRAAIYARQSLDRTGEGLAVARQLEDCRRLATDRGWHIIGEYVDNDVSASGRKPRPEYRRLLADMRGGHISAVVAWAADRLTRRPIEVEELIEVIEAHRVALATVSGEVDLSTPYGRAVARIFGAIARQEVEQKGARQARANLQRAQKGAARVTRRPFGYDLDGMTVRDHEAAELRKAADAVLRGATLAACVVSLNDRQVKTSTGSSWSVTTLRRVLLSPRYAGLVTYQGKPVGRALWPAVVTEDQHQSLVSRLTDPSRRTQTSTTTKYLLSGLAVCGICGARMFACPTGRRGGYWLVYKCKTHLTRKIEHVDLVVEGVIVARLSQPDAAALFVPEMPNVEVLRAEAGELRRRLDELTDAFADGLTTAEGYRRAAGRVRERLDAIERERSAASSISPLAPLLGADDVRTVWNGLALRAKRAVIDLLVTVTIAPAGKGVRFDPAQVYIGWRTP